MRISKNENENRSHHSNDNTFARLLQTHNEYALGSRTPKRYESLEQVASILARLQVPLSCPCPHCGSDLICLGCDRPVGWLSRKDWEMRSDLHSCGLIREGGLR